MDKRKLFAYLIPALLLYLLSTGLSFAAFSYLSRPEAVKSPQGPGQPPFPSDFELDPSLPKTEACPLNGNLHTQKEKEIWQTRRPLGLMIENHLDSRPQSGLYHADVIYEAVAEGGITRLLSLFYCAAASSDIQVGPIRSARTYFLDWVSEYGNFPLYAHVLGANCNRDTGSGCLNGAPADAMGQIRKYGWVAAGNDLDQAAVGFPTFWKDYERLGRPVASEHTMYSTTTKLWDYAAKARGLTNLDRQGNEWHETFRPWLFKKDAAQSDRPQSATLEFSHWSGYQDYQVRYEYDPQTNTYQRFTGGLPHQDLNLNKPLHPKVVVVQFTTERRANDGYDNNLRLLYGTIGKGQALIFQDGQETKATWQKKSRTERTLFFDAKTGRELELNPGQIWIHVVPIGTKISFIED